MTGKMFSCKPYMLLLTAVGFFVLFGISYSQLAEKPSVSPSHEIILHNFACVPPVDTVNVGDTVIWINKDPAVHSIISIDGKELKSPMLSIDRTYRHVFTAPGSYPFHCDIHPELEGMIVVKSAPADNNHLPGGHVVKIDNFAFEPASITIAAGDTVIWSNNDSSPHTVKSEKGSELNCSQLNKGQTYKHVFPTTGTYSYQCTIHPSMHGKVIVK